MTEIENMQQLHHRASVGEDLTADETQTLQNWYDELDHDESVINRENRPIDLEAMRERLEKTTAQIVASNRKVAALLKQNKKIRRENAELRRQLEARMAERQVA